MPSLPHTNQGSSDPSSDRAGSAQRENPPWCPRGLQVTVSFGREGERGLDSFLCAQAVMILMRVLLREALVLGMNSSRQAISSEI